MDSAAGTAATATTVVIFISMVNATDVFAAMFALDHYEQTVVVGGVWWLDFNPFGLQEA
jgi:hypothetical protein